MTVRVRIGIIVLGLVILGGIVAARTYRLDDEKPPKKGPVITGKLSTEKAAVEGAAIRKQINDFSAAYNKADQEGVLAIWSEDAEFITESGKTYRGKDQLRILLKRSLATNKGSKQTVVVQSVRFLKADVAIEQSAVTLTAPDGSSETGPYEAVWTKQGDTWLISLVRDLPGAADEETVPAKAKLKALTWLVGEWIDKDGKGNVSMVCKWGPGQTYLVQDFTVKREDGKVVNIQIRVGYDAANDFIRSWVFDSAGGFAGGFWTRAGNTWTVTSEGTQSDGRYSTSRDQWKFTNENEFTWSSKDREVDEQPMPDLGVTFTKKKSR